MNKDYVQWVKNPGTGRLIKVGGPTWRKLVKKGVLDGIVKTTIIDPQLHVVHDEIKSSDKIIETLEPIVSTRVQNIDQQSSYSETDLCSPNNKLGGNPPHQKGKTQKRLKQQEVTQLSTKAAIEMIQQNAESLADELEDIAYIEDENEYNLRMGKFEKDVEQMIYQQLLSKKETPRLKKEIVYDTEYTIVDEE